MPLSAQRLASFGKGRQSFRLSDSTHGRFRKWDFNSQLRSGGFGKRLFIGIVCGLTYFVLQRLAQNLATIYHWPLWIAHLAPPLLVLGGSQMYFRRRV